MVELIHDVWSMGRRGGGLLLAFAAACFAITAWQIHTGEGFFVVFPVVGATAVVVGVARLLAPDAGMPRRGTAPAVVLDEAHVDALYAHPRPFHFCTRCGLVSSWTTCDLCGSTADVLPVWTEDDVYTVLVAMGADLPDRTG